MDSMHAWSIGHNRSRMAGNGSNNWGSQRPRSHMKQSRVRDAVRVQSLYIVLRISTLEDKRSPLSQSICCTAFHRLLLVNNILQHDNNERPRRGARFEVRPKFHPACYRLNRSKDHPADAASDEQFDQTRT